MKHFINNPLFASTLLNLKQAEEAQHNETAIPFHREYPRPLTHRGFPTTPPLSQSWNEQPLEKGRHCTWALLFFPKGELVLMPNLSSGSSWVFFTLYQIIHVPNRPQCPFYGKREGTGGSDTDIRFSNAKLLHSRWKWPLTEITTAKACMHIFI